MGRQEIDNPALDRLDSLKSDVERELPELRAYLDDIAEDIGTGSVWYGPQARLFSADLEEEKDRLRNRADDLPDDIQETISNTPDTIYVYDGDEPV